MVDCSRSRLGWRGGAPCYCLLGEDDTIGRLGYWTDLCATHLSKPSPRRACQFPLGSLDTRLYGWLTRRSSASPLCLACWWATPPAAPRCSRVRALCPRTTSSSLTYYEVMWHSLSGRGGELPPWQGRRFLHYEIRQPLTTSHPHTLNASLAPNTE